MKSLLKLITSFTIIGGLTQHMYTQWAESILPTLSLSEKIGQLCMVAAVPTYKKNEEFILNSPYNFEPTYLTELIMKYKIGGIIFLGKGTQRNVQTKIHQFQKTSCIPLLIGLDGEWGSGMRLSDGLSFPKAMTLGALPPEKDYLIYELAQEIGKEFNTLGIHINFAPVADVNSNPKNPIINVRSFGDNPKKVAQKASLFVKGLQDASILGCVKHFPGHGDTHLDSHDTLPMITHTSQHLDSIELYPFKELINKSTDAIMVGHLSVPVLDPKNIPATFSKKIITNILKQTLGFNGLIITDGLGMGALTKQYEPGHIELNAFLAGNDILLCPLDVPKAIRLIKQEIESNNQLEKDLDKRVLKILRVKEHIVCNKRNELHQKSESTQVLKGEIYKHAMTLYKNELNLLPLQKNQNYILLSYGPHATLFTQTLANGINIIRHQISSNITDTMNHISAVQKTDTVIISIHTQQRNGMIELKSKTTRKNPNLDSLIQKLHAQNKKVMVVLFGNPYNLPECNQADTILVAYENDPLAQQTAAQALLGLFKPRGILPVKPY